MCVEDRQNVTLSLMRPFEEKTHTGGRNAGRRASSLCAPGAARVCRSCGPEAAVVPRAGGNARGGSEVGDRPSHVVRLQLVDDAAADRLEGPDVLLLPILHGDVSPHTLIAWPHISRIEVVTFESPATLVKDRPTLTP